MYELVTKNIASYVKEKGIALSMISRNTGIPYQRVYDSLGNKKRNRELSADEVVLICKFIEKNPMDFAEDSERE